MEHGHSSGAFGVVLIWLLGIPAPDRLGHYDWVPGDIMYTGLLGGDREKEPIPETLSDFTKVTTKMSKEVTDIQICG